MSVMPNNQQQQQQVNEENNLFPASYLLCLRHIYKYTCTITLNGTNVSKF